MKSTELMSMYAMCRECALEFGTYAAMQQHANKTSHVVIGTEERRIIVKKDELCIAN
jgi:hypothetical protein